jgi:hypothetical protein
MQAANAEGLTQMEIQKRMHEMMNMLEPSTLEQLNARNFAF